MRASFAIRPRSSARGLLLLAAILLNSACQVTPPSRETVSGEQATLPRAAARDAARLTIREALDAAAAGDVARASELLAPIDPESLDDALRFDYGLARATVALAAGDLPGARTVRGALTADGAAQRATQRTALTRLDARIAAAEGRHADAAGLLMTLPEREGSAQDVTDEIWAYVTRSPAYAVPALAASAGDSVTSGWWTLAEMLLSSFDVDAERRALADWQRRFPDHPATRHLPAGLAYLRTLDAGAQRIALLLPLSGPLAAAGAAVRDGFVAAYFHAGGEATVHLYDSTSGDFAALYEEMLADRIDVIVGPLDKSTLSAANLYGARTIPTLALNYLGPAEAAAPDLLQLGLAIEDEAHAIAERLVGDRLERVALFSTPDDWAQRAALEIRTALTGTPTAIVVDSQIDDPRTAPDAVGAALLVDTSLDRKAEVERLLGTSLEFVARRRDDVQAVVALTDSAKARVLMPALAYHFAGDLPIYGTSTLVQGAAGGGLRELEGARVTELPWRVYPDPVRDAVDAARSENAARSGNAARPASASPLDSLYALGSDAYRIVDRITSGGGRASSMRLLGATGVLTLGADGAFRREPVWAVVRNGALAALPTLVH